MTPRWGRFISRDPARDGLNWYAYCGGNPMVYVDPTEMFEIYRTSYGRQSMISKRDSRVLMVTCFRVGMTFHDRFKIAAAHGLSLSSKQLGLLLDVMDLALDAVAGDASGLAKTALGMASEEIASFLVVPEIISAVCDQKLRHEFEALYGSGSADKRYGAAQLAEMLSVLEPRYEGVHDFSTMIREADFLTVIEKWLFNYIYRWPAYDDYRECWYEYDVYTWD